MAAGPVSNPSRRRTFNFPQHPTSGIGDVLQTFKRASGYTLHLGGQATAVERNDRHVRGCIQAALSNLRRRGFDDCAAAAAGNAGGIPGAFIVGHSGRAEEAIAEIVEKRPDAIIVDLMLQSGSGFDVLEAIARQSAVSPVVVVLTNFTMPEYRDRAAGLGAAHFFDKSTGILEMVRVMARLVEGHQRRSNSNTNHA